MWSWIEVSLGNQLSVWERMKRKVATAIGHGNINEMHGGISVRDIGDIVVVGKDIDDGFVGFGVASEFIAWFCTVRRRIRVFEGEGIVDISEVTTR